MSNHTEDKIAELASHYSWTGREIKRIHELSESIHNNAIQSCIDVVREMQDEADLVDDRMSLNTLNELEENLQSLKK